MGAQSLRRQQTEADHMRDMVRQVLSEQGASGVMEQGGLQAAQSADLSTQELIKEAEANPNVATLTMTRGDTRFLEIAAKQADGVTAFDITNATLWFTAKVNVGDADPGQFQKHTGTGGGITKTNAAGGIARVHIEPANTEGLTADTTLVWDVQMRTTEGYVYTLDWGSLTVERAPDITTTRTVPA